MEGKRERERMATRGEVMAEFERKVSREKKLKWGKDYDARRKEKKVAQVIENRADGSTRTLDILGYLRREKKWEEKRRTEEKRMKGEHEDAFYKVTSITLNSPEEKVFTRKVILVIYKGFMTWIKVAKQCLRGL